LFVVTRYHVHGNLNLLDFFAASYTIRFMFWNHPGHLGLLLNLQVKFQYLISRTVTYIFCTMPLFIFPHRDQALLLKPIFVVFTSFTIGIKKRNFIWSWKRFFTPLLQTTERQTELWESFCIYIRMKRKWSYRKWKTKAVCLWHSRNIQKPRWSLCERQRGLLVSDVMSLTIAYKESKKREIYKEKLLTVWVRIP